MSDRYECNLDGCDYDGETPEGLRSHVAASTDDDHQDARSRRAWEEWYPAAFGVVDAGSDPESDDATGHDPPSEGGESAQGDDSDDPADDGGSTPSDPPAEGASKGGSAAGRDRDDYAEQWDEGRSDPSDPPSEGGESAQGDDSDDPDDDGGSTGSDTPSKGGDKGASKGGPRRLATLAAPLVALLLLLVRGDRADQRADVGGAAAPDAEDAEASTESDDEQFSTIA